MNRLFSAALSAAPLDTVCTLLRVGGLQSANWDAFEESQKAFEDYNWLLKTVLRRRGLTSGRRVGLLMYCQAVEMTAPHEVLANLLRCAARNPYVIDPFADLVRRKKEVLSSTIPPSAKQKFLRIKYLAQVVRQTELESTIDDVFDNRVRNAFSHSDYILTDSSFRFSEGGFAQHMNVETLDGLLARAFTFYGVFLDLHREWLRILGRGKRFHKCPNYEVLELLVAENEGVYGFHVHFSNSTRSKCSRRKSGTEATNVFFETDGTINYMVGLLDDLEPVWKINGSPVKDWDELA
ncbi:MAG: hypothetical protein QMD53_03195 [Actinomycetota bacterium]|nr:hypothetical protein [Actinomycetota bacterium]